jgi:hypothetical protein
MANTPSNQFVDYPIFNQLMPKEGPKTVPFSFDFTAQSAYFIDLQNQQSRSFITIVQAVYVRNPGTVSVTILFDVAGQQIDFPPQSEGYLPVLVTNPPRFTATSNGGAANVQLMLLNVAMPAAIWPIVPYIIPQSAGAVVVTDVALDSTVSGGLLNNLNHIQSNSDAIYPDFKGRLMFSGVKATIGSTAIITPGAGLTYFFTGFQIFISQNASLAVAGNLVISLMQNAAIQWQHTISLPAAAFAVAAPTSVEIANVTGGFMRNGSALLDVLNINLSVALATGTVSYNVQGGFTSIIGV